MDTFFHSVTLESDLCKGCINCLKRCPTEAIRVRGGKAQIRKEFCIDCGECIRICPHHAKKAIFDRPEMMSEYKYKIALPPPSLYAQFNNLEDKTLVLDALISFGFDDVFEVAKAAEMVSEMTRRLIKEKSVTLPVISSACPSITRLIRVKFPNLIKYISPISAPMEIAAELAVTRAVKKTGLQRKDIGTFFISPCPAKVTAVYSPLDREKSQVDGVIAMMDVYPKLLSYMKDIYNNNRESKFQTDTERAGRIGISWGKGGGEASGLLTDNYLSADGIENVIRVLGDLEDDRLLKTLEFIELNACSGGCVGGVLCVENPYMAKVKLNVLRKYLPVSGAHLGKDEKYDMFRGKKIQYMPVYRLGGTVEESIRIMGVADELTEKFPGLDCGCCGAPTCRAHAEDVAQGSASEKDCIHILKKFVHQFADEMKTMK